MLAPTPYDFIQNTPHNYVVQKTHYYVKHFQNICSHFTSSHIVSKGFPIFQ